MKKTFLLIGVCSALTFAACSDSSDTTDDFSTHIQDEQINSLLENAAVPTNNDYSNNDSNTLHEDQNALNAPSGTLTAGLNPPHGEPGHDCAIPVGAPLNGSAPTNNDNISFPGTGTPSASPATMNQKMNPPHGEPGHDCAVPVGAPLN